MAKTIREALDSVAKVVETTPNQIRVRVRMPDEFVRLRTITMDEKRGIDALIGPLKSDPQGGAKVQSLRFARAKGWTESTAEKWARDHGYTPR
jgi:hypothetical protein